MLSGRGLCDELITRPEESYRLCCVVVCDLETSRIGAPYIYDISSLRVKPKVQFMHRSNHKQENRKLLYYHILSRQTARQPDVFLTGIHSLRVTNKGASHSSSSNKFHDQLQNPQSVSVFEKLSKTNHFIHYGFKQIVQCSAVHFNLEILCEYESEK